MNELGQLAASSTQESLSVQKAENGFVLNYYYSEFGPDVQKNEQRTIIVENAAELGSTIAGLFKS